MVRRARFSRRLLICLLPLAVTACGDEAIPPATGPAHQTPTMTATPSPEPTATPTTPPTPRATPPPTVAATATPEPTPTAAPEAPAIEHTALTWGEPRPLPAGIALYYQVAGCMGCGWGFGDVKRVVFDEVAGTYREDRPLAFFDGKGTVVDADVGPGGQEMAAMICHVGSCAGTHAPVSGDALQHHWISRDAGRTWDDLGPVPPSTRLAKDPSAFGEEAALSSGAASGRTIAWRSRGPGSDLFAIAEEDGGNQQVYGSREPLGDWQRGVSITGDLVVWWMETYFHEGTYLAGARMVDLETATVREVAGLSLPLGFDPAADQLQEDFYYLLMAARPAPER